MATKLVASSKCRTASESKSLPGSSNNDSETWFWQSLETISYKETTKWELTADKLLRTVTIAIQQLSPQA